MNHVGVFHATVRRCMWVVLCVYVCACVCARTRAFVPPPSPVFELKLFQKFASEVSYNVQARLDVGKRLQRTCKC